MSDKETQVDIPVCGADCKGLTLIRKELAIQGTHLELQRNQLERIESHLLTQSRLYSKFFTYVERLMGLEKDDLTPTEPTPTNGGG